MLILFDCVGKIISNILPLLLGLKTGKIEQSQSLSFDIAWPQDWT